MGVMNEMKKTDKTNKIYYKWWFQMILVPAFILGLILWIKVSSPIHKVDKEAANIDVYATSKFFGGKAYHSPLTASAAFFKAIQTEDVELFKRCNTLRVLYEYCQEYHKGNMSDEVLKQDLHKANEDIKKQYGDNWYSKLKYIEYGTDSSSGDKVYIYKLYYGDELFIYNSFVFKVEREYYVTPACLVQYLVNFDKESR